MGPENKNLFNNRLGMRPSRNLSAMDELNRISAQTQAQNQPQTPQSVSTSSDIVLSGGSAPKNQGKKRFLIILGIITVFAILTGVGVYFALQQNKGKGSSSSSTTGIHDSAVREAMAQYSDDVIKLEDVFIDIDKSKNNGAIFEDASQKALKKYLDSTNSFSETIKDKTSVREKVLEDFNTLKERLEKNIDSYNSAYKIYENYYNAIKTSNVALISEYLKSSDSGEKTAAEAYTKYINGLNSYNPETAIIYNNYDYIKGIFHKTISDAISNNSMTELIIKIRDGLIDDEE